MFRVVILGHSDMLVNLIAGVSNANCKIVGVLRYENIKTCLLYQKIRDFLFPSKEYNYIKSYDLHEMRVNSVNSDKFKKELLNLNPDIVLVGTWSEKFNKEILQLPKIAMINVHPSMLPKYRGPNPYLRTIINGETESGITFHLMTEEFDAGPILMQKAIEIKRQDTGKELRQRTVLAARDAVTELLDRLDNDFIIPVEQSEQRATYYSQVTNDEIMLDFTKPAEEVFNRIRGFHPWSKTYFPYKKHFFSPNPYNVEILENNTGNDVAGLIVDKSEKEKSITVVCGDGKLLKMSKISLYGRFLKFFTGLYLKRFVKISEIVL